MNIKKLKTIRLKLTAVVMFLTVLTVGCGKSDIKKTVNDNHPSQTEEFSTKFFTECNLPYQKITQADVQNTPDEYLFYINKGIVYHTLNDYNVVIVNRDDLNEGEGKRETEYNGELFQLFEDDNVDMLKISASGDYALLALPSAVPDWENNTVIVSFMQYSKQYKQEKRDG